jgi:hypothetical protein
MLQRTAREKFKWARSNGPTSVLGMSFALMLLSASQSAAPAQAGDVKAKVGSQWTYEVTDEITKKKILVEQVVTEINRDQLVIRTSLPLSPGRTGVIVVDKNWNYIESGQWRYNPHDFGGIQRSSAGVTVVQYAEIDASSRQPTGWSAPTKVTLNARVVSNEALITKAGAFQTTKVEFVRKVPTPNIPLSETVITETKWFASAADHYVKMINETRVDGRLRDKSSYELQNFSIDN